jgi:hypothetical protein
MKRVLFTVGPQRGAAPSGGLVPSDTLPSSRQANAGPASTAAVAIDTANPLSSTYQVEVSTTTGGIPGGWGRGHGYPGTNVVEICQALGVGLAVGLVAAALTFFLLAG